MSPQFTTGVTFAWILASASLAAVFGVAYGTRRREPEHLVFALLSLCIAAHTWAVDVTLGESSTAFVWRLGAALGVISTVVGAACFLHYALVFGGIKKSPHVPLIYGLATLTWTLAIWLDPFDESVIASLRHHPLGVSVSFSGNALSPAGMACALPIAGAPVFGSALLGRAYLAGRKDGLAAWIGGLAFTVAMCSDLAVLLNVYSAPWLTPVGFLVFAFGVGCSLLIRHAVLGKELESRTLELERSYAYLRATQAELVRQQQLAAVGELAAIIAHEVRNPLAIITNAVAGLHRRNLRKEDETLLLDILDEESRRLNRLVGDLLRYARPVKVHRQAVDVRNVIQRALHGVSDMDHIQVRIDEPPSLELLSGDPDLLRVVLGNLIDNAVQAMTDGGELDLAIREENRCDRAGITIVIRDTGPGMSEDVKKRATDPFFTTKPSGTGLGLAIVARIIDAHGGEMSIESEIGEGTAVSVFLPLESMLDDLEELNGGPISGPVPMIESL